MTRVRNMFLAERGAPIRVQMISVALIAAFVAILGKGANLALQPGEVSAVRADVFQAEARRADIVDRNGELLATSVEVYSLFADPRAIWDADETAAALAEVFQDLDVSGLAARLSNRDRAFVWVRRQLTPRQRQAVFELGLEGLGFRRELRRAYPRGTLAGHALGYAGVDGNGLSGVEFSQDERLREGEDPLQLTLHAGVQFAVEAELAAAAAIHDIEGGAGLLMHTRTGEVLAVASWPPINPNRARELDVDDPARLNRASTAVYELGSVFKPLTVALALDSGVLHPADTFDVSDPLTIRGREITDTHPINGRVTATTIISESSNIGTVKVSVLAGVRRLREFLGELGLFERSPIELSGSAAPLLPAEWDELSSATVSYGHGIAVSPVSFLSAYGVLANQGEYVPPALILDERRRPQPRRVLSAPTSDLVLAMLREAVVTGTGAQAEVAGYRVAGKTGTAEKPIAGGYSETENVNSFAAIFPADRPEYALLIVLDNPKTAAETAGGVTGGSTAAWNAAPTAGRVIERVAPILGIAPKFDTPALRLQGRSEPDSRSTL
ncbi:MAG: penicillin-binding protein 2 [Pseudomonadota bacterium]